MTNKTSYPRAKYLGVKHQLTQEERKSFEFASVTALAGFLFSVLGMFMFMNGIHSIDNSFNHYLEATELCFENFQEVFLFHTNACDRSLTDQICQPYSDLYLSGMASLHFGYLSTLLGSALFVAGIMKMLFIANSSKTRHNHNISTNH